MFIHKTLQTSAIALLTLGLTACGGGGSSSSGTVTPPPPPVADTTAPTVSFSQTSLSLTSGQTGASTVTSSDNVGVTSGPTVSCTNGGTFAGSTFTAPNVTVDTISECTATVSDAAGNQNTAILSVNISPDTSAPTIAFSPAALTVSSGNTAASTLTATDNVAVTSGPTVTCTNGGSFADNTFTAPLVTENMDVVCTATASDGSGNEGTAELTVTVTPPPPAVTISGSVTFDHVPFNTSSSALNYNSITQDPAPGLTVEALNSAGTVIESTVSDSAGGYSLQVDPNTDVRIRVKAELVQTSGAQWNVRVIDNTSGDAPYALQGALANSGTTDTTRNLNASSGWGGSSYTSTRAAAPFAILAPIYESMQRIVAVDPDVVFPAIDFSWSTNNRSSTSFNIATGDIGTSSYVTSSNGDRRVLILGDANNDTDEYDEHVVIHEWGHYFEDQLSRSDSIGGPHGLADRLDARVALGEGFGNALSGIMTDDPFYRDSFGSAQGSGFFINVENNNNQNEGWYNEASAQSILYDIYDDDDDAADTISAGLEPIYNVLTSASYTGSSLFTTIFLFLDEYNSNNAGDVAAVNELSAAQSINGTGAAGIGETNNGTESTSLPVYKIASVGGNAVEICSVTTNGTGNKLGNRIYVAFNITSPGLHTLRVQRTSGSANTDPDFRVFRNGTLLGIADSGTVNVETGNVNFTNTGQHIIDAYDFNEGNACYDFTITR